MMTRKAIARAPASIGNVGSGFDCLGQAFGAAWDEVSAQKLADDGEDGPIMRLGEVSGLVRTLPGEIRRNTALRAGQAVLELAKADFAVRLDVIKGIPMSAGLGGSAASAVAATLAVNALLDKPLNQDQLFACAMAGETASSDPPPPDNVAAALYGGLVLITKGEALTVTVLPLPTGLHCLVFHPALMVNTADARNLLSESTALPQTVAQMRHLGGLVAGCFMDDKALIAQNLSDQLIEPQRAYLVPPFAAVKAAALKAGALGCSLSGSGPSVFAWVEDTKKTAVQAAMHNAFEQHHCAADLYQAPLTPCVAEVITK